MSRRARRSTRKPSVNSVPWPPKGTKIDLTALCTSSVIDPVQVIKVTNSAPAKLFKDSWLQMRDVFRVLDLFPTMRLKEKYEDEFAVLDGQLDVANLMAHCTICKAKVAELRSACACPRPLKLLEARAKVTVKSKSTISALGFSEPVPVALGLGMAQLMGSVPALCEETREVHRTAAQPFNFIVCLSRLILVDGGSVQLVSTDLVDDRK